MIRDKVYRPHGNIRQVFRWVDELEPPPVQVLVEGPANTGKSRALAEFDYECCTKWPHSRGLVLRRYRADLHKSYQRTFEDMVLWPGHPLLSRVGGGKGENRTFYEWDNGATLTLGHMEDPQRYYSSEWDWIHYVEVNESRHDQWERLFRALRKGERPTQCPFKPGLLIGEMNPDTPQFYLNQLAKLGKVHRIITRHKDNPAISPEELELLSNLTGVRRKRLYEGVWCAAEGQILDCFDADRHIVQPEALPGFEWAMAGLDFGRRSPGCLLVGQFDAEGLCYVTHEIYRTGYGIDDWAEALLRLNDLVPLSLVVADCADGGTGAIDAINKRIGLYGKDGAPLVQPVRKRKIGERRWGYAMREHLYALLKRGEILFLDDPFRLYGGPDPALADKGVPRSVTDEIAEYVYWRVPEGRDIHTARKEEPDPHCADHGVDALIYLASEAWAADFTAPEEDDGLPDDSYAAVLRHAEVWESSPATDAAETTFDYTPQHAAFVRRRRL